MGGSLQGEEHQSPHLRHSHIRRRLAATKNVVYALLYTDVLSELSKWVCFFPNRKGKGLLAPGGQCAVCLVSDRGASQLSTSAANTRVRVHFHIHLVLFNHIQLARMTTTYYPIGLPFLDKTLMGCIVNKNLFDSFTVQ